MTQNQTRTQEQVKVKDQSGDPIMTQEQTRTQNHGDVVSETAKQTQAAGADKGKMVSEQAKMQGEAQKSMKQAKTATKNNGAAKNVMTNRPPTVKGNGAGRK
jgi:hypothetical protein